MNQCLKSFNAPARRLASRFMLAGLAALAFSAEAVLAADTAPAQFLFEVKERVPAPDFILGDMNDTKRRLSDFRDKVVLVNFWATWCPPCRREMPSIERLYQAMKGKDFEILAINVAEDPDTVSGFTGALDAAPSFPILFDTDSSVAKAWPVMGLPTTFILDKQGRIAYRAMGAREFDNQSILAQIQALLDAQ